MFSRSKKLNPNEMPHEFLPWVDLSRPRRKGDDLCYPLTCPECKKERLTEATFIRHRKIKSAFCRRCTGRRINFRGGRFPDGNGYILRLIRTFPDEYHDILLPMADKSGYILEHRAVIAISIGRPLDSREVVRHLNGKKDDNRLENLVPGTHGENYQDHATLALENAILRQQNLRLALALSVVGGEGWI